MTTNPNLIEEYYIKFTSNLALYLHEGPVQVDLDYLEKLNPSKEKESTLIQYFNVIESQDKITLINNEFIIWITPYYTEEISSTLVLIALNHHSIPQLELAFLTSDIYNSSKLILKIIEKLLHDIKENEESIKPYISKSQ